MRDIRFRAWDKQLKPPQMFDWHYIKTNEPWAWFSAHEEDKYVILMQFTGLYDKNGKEIFEGDILAWERYAEDRKLVNHCAVMYGECGGGGYEEGYNTIGFWLDDGLGSGLLDKLDDRTVVAGNIYEHPELLKGEK